MRITTGSARGFGSLGALVLLTAAAVLGGCVQGPADGGGEPASAPVGPFGAIEGERLPAPDKDFSTVIDPDHGMESSIGHHFRELHVDSFGLELVGYTPMTELMGGESPTNQDSGYIAIDTWENYVCVTKFAGTGGFVIVDIEDPANPTVVSSVNSGFVDSDCQFTDDGNYLVLATIAGVTDGLPAGSPPVSDAAAKGVEVFDVRDKADPELLYRDQQKAEINSYHNVFTAKINGTNYVFQMYTANIFAIDEGADQMRWVSQLPNADHDMWVGQHPLTGEWIIITGANRGIMVYNIEDPANPVELGVWQTDGEEGLEGWHRQWPIQQTVDGRAYVLVGGEEPEDLSIPHVVVDFTDPADMFTVGTWPLPGEPVSGGGPANFYTFSPHEFETWNGYAAMGLYHAGVWLIDIGTPERAANPVTLGYYFPTEVPQLEGGTSNHPFLYNPDVWGAYFDERGYVVTADWGSGLYVLKFDATQTVDA